MRCPCCNSEHLKFNSDEERGIARLICVECGESYATKLARFQTKLMDVSALWREWDDSVNLVEAEVLGDSHHVLDNIVYEYVASIGGDKAEIEHLKKLAYERLEQEYLDTALDVPTPSCRIVDCGEQLPRYEWRTGFGGGVYRVELLH